MQVSMTSWLLKNRGDKIMMGSCRLNNKNMRGMRRDNTYQCIMVDLAMLGVISKEECEMLIGAGIPNGLVLPDGKSGKLISEEDLPEQPVVTDNDEGTTEPEPEQPVVTDNDEGTTEPEPEPEPEVTDDDEGTTESDN